MARHTDALEVAVLNVEQKVLHLLLVVRTCFFFFFFFANAWLDQRDLSAVAVQTPGGKKIKHAFHSTTHTRRATPRPLVPSATIQPSSPHTALVLSHVTS